MSHVPSSGYLRKQESSVESQMGAKARKRLWGEGELDGCSRVTTSWPLCTDNNFLLRGKPKKEAQIGKEYDGRRLVDGMFRRGWWWSWWRVEEGVLSEGETVLSSWTRRRAEPMMLVALTKPKLYRSKTWAVASVARSGSSPASSRAVAWVGWQ